MPRHRLSPESTIEDVKLYLDEQIKYNTDYLEKLARSGQRRTNVYLRIEARNGVLIEMMQALDPAYSTIVL